MIELHPEILRKDGKAQYAILTWEEFLRVQEALEDAADVLELRRAREETKGEPLLSLEEVKRGLELE